MRSLRDFWRLITGHTRRRRLAIEQEKFRRKCDDAIEELSLMREQATDATERLRILNEVYRIRRIQKRA